MNICFLFYKNKDVGMGHYFRSMELVREANTRGHDTTVLGNSMFIDLSQRYVQIRQDVPYDFWHTIHEIRPDWIVIDLQDEPSDDILKICDEFGVKTLLLNGVGREMDGAYNLVVVQGLSDNEKFYSGSKYVILRKKVFETSQMIMRGDFNFVWGGASDKIGLIKAFQEYMPNEKANIITTSFNSYKAKPTKNHAVMIDGGEAMLLPMANSNKAIVAMGMTVWELIAMGIPCKVFSISQGHLDFALRMAQEGLVDAYPEIGIPDKDNFIEFVRRPMGAVGEKCRPDEFGAQRILELMENYEK